MIFTSFTFIVFFVIVFTVYWRVKGLHAKHLFLLLASLVFYGWWDYRFLLLIGVAICLSYFGALALGRYRGRRLAVVSTSIALLLTILGVFKYADFLFDAIRDALLALGMDVPRRPFSIVLPIGISFFTFHGISYLVDVYRGKIQAEPRFTKVALYILFFPQLVAGPIVRASNFMPQLAREPRFDSDEVLRGTKLFLTGFVYKAIFADSIATYVDEVYKTLGDHNAAEQVLASIGFYAQIYFDFAGYSIMAIGLSRMMGYRLPRNFDFPYVSQSVTEFWRRWHISLSSWLRDYLYISLGGNRSGEARQLLNIMITMLLGGLWHGASWNFVIWGGMHGLALCVHKLYLRGPAATGVLGALRRIISSVPVSWTLTQLFVLLCWVPFRAVSFDNTTQVWHSFLTLRVGDVLQLDGHVVAIILAPLAFDTLIVSGRVPLPLPGWRATFAGRPWRLAFVMGAICGLALLVMPLEVKNFIYFKF
ncbi:MAG TPA: MBOAT family O-acyltransferase [Gammaproteobacteria bacterium]|jgi:D-alanyl-lipoteichoic acid acyltransferase DltB (MBOAT superfamily)